MAPNSPRITPEQNKGGASTGDPEGASIDFEEDTDDDA